MVISLDIFLITQTQLGCTPRSDKEQTLISYGFARTSISSKLIQLCVILNLMYNVAYTILDQHIMVPHTCYRQASQWRQFTTHHHIMNNTMSCIRSAVEPLNKGHFGDNINSAVLFFMERLSSSQRFSMYGNYREGSILVSGAVSLIERFKSSKC